MSIQLPGEFDLLDIPWLIFGAYWLISARNLKPVKTREPVANRAVHIILVATAGVLLFTKLPALTVLRHHFVPQSPAIYDLGLAMSFAGVALAIWARYHIGQYWSARVTVKHDHKLIQTGPYARMRHPIYSGLLLGLSGTALAIGRWSALLAVFAIMLLHCSKAIREQRLMEKEFGEQYRDYRRRTGFLLPRLRQRKQNGRADPLPLKD
jgi:protein-S-isoprenylcysteine O-methyltransferase Ste14